MKQPPVETIGLAMTIDESRARSHLVRPVSGVRDPMLHALLLDHIRDPHASWSCGRFGAIAEFHRDAEEPVEITSGAAIAAATSRGAIRIEALPALRPVAYETISKCIQSWGQGVALCLPRYLALMSGRTVVAELGPDVDAVRPQDRDALLFDLGLGGPQAEICVRTPTRRRSRCFAPRAASRWRRERFGQSSEHSTALELSDLEADAVQAETAAQMAAAQPKAEQRKVEMRSFARRAPEHPPFTDGSSQHARKMSVARSGPTRSRGVRGTGRIEPRAAAWIARGRGASWRAG
jgi:hypothetical protein